MSLSQLKAFQVVAELENVTRAAEVMNVAQPSLSKMISRLEQDLGVPLFDRVGRRLKLNRFGEVYLRRVRNVFDELEQARRELNDMTSLESGRVAVGVTTSQILPNVFEEYFARYPDMKFRLFQIVGRYEIARQLRDGAFDFCISSRPIIPVEAGMEVASRELLSEEIFLAVCKSHRLARRKSVTLEDLVDEKFIAHTRDDGLRETIDNVFAEVGFEPNVVFESSDTGVIGNLVAAGTGIALLPAFWWTSGRTQNLARVRVARPSLRRSILLSWMERRYLSPAARHFSQFITEYLAQYGKLTPDAEGD